MEITCRVYKPRRARESPLYRLVEQHLEELLRVWPARILDHLGLSPPPQEKPPPPRELIRVPVDEEGRELQAG